MRVIDPATIGIQRVDHLKELALPPSCLGSSVEARGSWVLAGDWEVAEGNRHLALADLLPCGGAMGTTEVGIDDEQLALTAQMILRTERRNRGAG